MRTPSPELAEADTGLGAGSALLRQTALDLLRRRHELDALADELKWQSEGGRSVPIDGPRGRLNAVCDFICQGGDVPPGLELRRTVHVASSFATHLPRFVGCFLVTKGGIGPPGPRRAVYAIRGICGGRVALQRLPALGFADAASVRKLAVADLLSPGGLSADPVAVQRHFWMLFPETLVDWASAALSNDVPFCKTALQEAIADVIAEKERARQLELYRAEYERKLAWRTAWRQRRGPLVKELWAALWNSHFGRAKSVFVAIARIGISPADKVFHEVTLSLPGGDGHYVVLEPAGAVEEEEDFRIAPNHVRRHASASALDAYECMRGDEQAPPGHAELHKWLRASCGPSRRSKWQAHLFQECHGRNMMLGSAFEQLILVDLIKDAARVEIPGESAEESRQSVQKATSDFSVASNGSQDEAGDKVEEDDDEDEEDDDEAEEDQSADLCGAGLRTGEG